MFFQHPESLKDLKKGSRRSRFVILGGWTGGDLAEELDTRTPYQQAEKYRRESGTEGVGCGVTNIRSVVETHSTGENVLIVSAYTLSVHMLSACVHIGTVEGQGEGGVRTLVMRPKSLNMFYVWKTDYLIFKNKIMLIYEESYTLFLAI